MSAIAPFISFILLVFIIQLTGDENYMSWRRSILISSVIWGSLLTVYTELLSLFNLITFGGILGIWIVTGLILVFMLLRLIRQNPFPSVPGVNLDLSRFETVSWSGVIFIALILLVIGLAAPPNTWDSMTYHMSRVMHWIQNKRVSFYPTHILRQLHQTPGAEFIILHFQILSGGDRLANLVQWFSMTGCLLGVSMIARQLGGNGKEQVTAAVLAATLPMGILQSTSTQNDYAVTYWLIAMAYFMIGSLPEKTNKTDLLGAGGSLGLALLTKATAYIYAVPFCMWLAARKLKTQGKKAGKPIAVIFAVVIALNAGFYIRNCKLYRKPLGPGLEGNWGQYENEITGIAPLLSNLLRNISLQIETPFLLINYNIERAVRKLHDYIGIDADDPRTSFAGRKFKTALLSNHEDTAANPLHFVLIILSFSVCFISFGKYKREKSTVYSLSILLGFILFCFYLKWQPWNSRLHLPLFVLSSPFVSIVLFKRFNKGKFGFIIMILLLLSSLPWVFHNRSRSMTGSENIFETSRQDLFFINGRLFKRPYIKAMEFLQKQGISTLGLEIGKDCYEYPLWKLSVNKRAFRIEHISLENVSGILSGLPPFRDFRPEAILSITGKRVEPFVYKGNEYVYAASFGDKRYCSVDLVDIYLRQSNQSISTSVVQP